MRSVMGSGSADAQLPISSHILEEEPEGGLSGRCLHQDVHHDSPRGFMMCFPIMILRFNALLSALSIPSHPVSVHLLPCCAQGRSKMTKPVSPSDVSHRITVCLSKLPDRDQHVADLPVYAVAASVC